ncbi:MAG: FAD-binding protein, partial [Cyanobacteria bacterium P01_H01_bin.119]
MPNPDWPALTAALGDIETVTDPNLIEKLSKDYYYFSPVLKQKLADKVADLVVRPKTEADVLTVAQACAAQQIPLTVRGAGTGNYGQCIPLEGGVILDLSKLNQVKWVKPG